jgi:dTDP-4-amino-4,6-dideoxygalactose transaminase
LSVLRPAGYAAAMDKLSATAIDKNPAQPAFLRPASFFPRARDAFKAFLAETGLGPDERVLLPAYIGWSPREGSGVFDPICELGVAAGFYGVDERLRVDLDDLEAQLITGGVRVVVLIHYFGYVDPGYEQAVSLARAAGARILEDEAHAMLTDLVGGGCGRLGDACIFSLHKMLPVTSGGMLVHNGPSPTADGPDREGLSPWQYDLFAIAQKRRRNAEALTALLEADPIEGVEPLWPRLQSFEVPQTYPVLIHGASRFDLYTRMNEEGFGVVSLYHTLIDRLSREAFPRSHAVADKILNLPVHQDVDQFALERLVMGLRRELSGLRRTP